MLLYCNPCNVMFSVDCRHSERYVETSYISSLLAPQDSSTHSALAAGTLWGALRRLQMHICSYVFIRLHVDTWVRDRQLGSGILRRSVHGASGRREDLLNIVQPMTKKTIATKVLTAIVVEF
jgi:hypothetical protein